MITIIFKNVGQGDSIFLEWSSESNKDSNYGIIDCNHYKDENPIINELRSKRVTKLKFILLSHVHYDHYSGMGDLLEYIITNKITIEYFYHTFCQDYLLLFDKNNQSSPQNRSLEKFLINFGKAVKLKLIENIVGELQHQTKALTLYKNVELSFLAPNGHDYLTFTQTRLNGVSPDSNKLATISLITNGTNGILCTSDASKNSFQRIRNKNLNKIVLAQVPHHGSEANLDKTFWESLIKEPNCPALFSIGDVKKDKLPKKTVVEFFENQGFYNTSTNFVNGIKEQYLDSSDSPVEIEYSSKAETNLNLLGLFGKPSKQHINSYIQNRFQGDKLFSFNF